MKQKGFTIIELLIATSVFSVILIIALAGFTGIGNLFYKGVAVTQTQSVTAQILTDVKTNIQTASTVSGQLSGNGYNYYCIGNVRYTYKLAAKLTSSNDDYSNGPTSNYALVRDTLPGPTACGAPCVNGCQGTQIAFNNPQELLSNNMRLEDFSVVGSASQVYNIHIAIAYGDDDQFENLSDPNTIACTGSASQQKFCAVDRLSTSVYEGLK